MSRTSALLRAVLERIDCRPWLTPGSVRIVDAATTKAELTAMLEGVSATVTQGTQLVTHPVASRLHHEACQTFSKNVSETLAYCRTTVATALVNSARTCRNLCNNLGAYTAGRRSMS